MAGYKKWPGEPDGLWSRPAPSTTRVRDERSVQQRLAVLEDDILLPYPCATSVESEIFDIVERGRRKRFYSGAMIVGPRSNGRSTLAQQIVRKLETAWLMQMPTRPGHDEFWLTLIDKARSYRSYGSGMHSAEREFRAIETLQLAKSSGLKLIIIDHCENLLEVTPKRRRMMLHCVAAAWKRSEVPIVLVVSPKLASTIVDDHERVGLHEILLLPQWRLDEDFLDLLEGWERALPLQRPSGLTQRELAMHLYALCEGRLGVLAAVLKKAATAAIQTKQEQITMTLLDEIGLEVPSTFSGFWF